MVLTVLISPYRAISHGLIFTEHPSYLEGLVLTLEVHGQKVHGQCLFIFRLWRQEGRCELKWWWVHRRCALRRHAEEFRQRNLSVHHARWEGHDLYHYVSFFDAPYLVLEARHYKKERFLRLYLHYSVCANQGVTLVPARPVGTRTFPGTWKQPLDIIVCVQAPPVATQLLRAETCRLFCRAHHRCLCPHVPDNKR